MNHFSALTLGVLLLPLVVEAETLENSRERLKRSQYWGYWQAQLENHDQFCATYYRKWNPAKPLDGGCAYPPEYLQRYNSYDSNYRTRMYAEQSACRAILGDVCAQREREVRERAREQERLALERKREEEDLRRQHQEVARRSVEETREKKSAEERARRAQELAEIRSNNKQPTNCVDLAAANNIEAINQVMLEPTRKMHFTFGRIEQYDTGVLLFEYKHPNTGRIHFLRGVATAQTTWHGKQEMAIGSLVIVIGRYVANERVPLASGASAPMITLDVTCIEHFKSESDVVRAAARIVNALSSDSNTVQTNAQSKQPEQERKDTVWRLATTVANDKTNVRATEDISSLVVTQLMPNEQLLVRVGEGDWWAAKSKEGTRFLGYVRKDRVILAPDERK